MVTGKEAWADVQRMKHTAGQYLGMLCKEMCKLLVQADLHKFLIQVS